jgi:hypothetical protein
MNGSSRIPAFKRRCLTSLAFSSTATVLCGAVTIAIHEDAALLLHDLRR